MKSRLHIKCLSLFGLAGALTGMACTSTASSPTVQCSAAGAKHFEPAMSEEEICARFATAMREAAPDVGPVSIALEFLPRGMASATVGARRFELAVSDRRFSVRDIDRLAKDVVGGLRR